MKTVYFIQAILLALLFAGCGSDSGKEQANAQPAPPQGLSEWQLEHGIGPITSKVTLEAVNVELAQQGQALFDVKCAPCHKVDERYIGPPLGGVVKRRTPEYIMNMMLNPDEMVKKHPEAQKLLAKYLAPMTYQNVSEADARALLEFLRTQADVVPKPE